MPSRYRVRAVVNAVNLTTPLGLVVGALGRATFTAGPYGLRLGTGYRLPLPKASAFTVGNVVVGVGQGPLPTAGRMLRHESRHATQYAFLGLLMPPLYGLAALWSWAVTGDWWSQNPFERLAGLADGSYRKRRPRWRRSAPHPAK